MDVDIRCGRCDSDPNLTAKAPIVAHTHVDLAQTGRWGLVITRWRRGGRNGSLGDERALITVRVQPGEPLPCRRCSAKPSPGTAALGSAWVAATRHGWPYLLIDHLGRITGPAAQHIRRLPPEEAAQALALLKRDEDKFDAEMERQLRQDPSYLRAMAEIDADLERDLQRARERRLRERTSTP